MSALRRIPPAWIVLAVLAILLYAFITRQLRPVRRIVGALEQIGAGDLHLRIEHDDADGETRNELAVIARSIDATTASITIWYCSVWSARPNSATIATMPDSYKNTVNTVPRRPCVAAIQVSAGSSSRLRKGCG